MCLLCILTSYTEFKKGINILGKAGEKIICHRFFLLVISGSFFSSQADISLLNNTLFEITKVWNSHLARNKNSLAQTTNRERGVSVIKFLLLYYLGAGLLCDLRLFTELDSQKLTLTCYWKQLTPVTPSTQSLTYMALNSALISSGRLMKFLWFNSSENCVMFRACQYKREKDKLQIAQIH